MDWSMEHDHLADEQEMNAKQTGSWERFMEKMAYVPKDTHLSKEVDKTEDRTLQNPAADLVLFLEPELQTTMKAEVQLAIETAMRELLRRTVEETLRNKFLDGHEATEERVKDSSEQFIKYVLTHFVATATLDSVLALNFDKWSSSDGFMDAIAESINKYWQLMEPIMIRMMERTAMHDESGMHSTSCNRHTSMPPPLRSSSESGRDSSEKEGWDERSRLETERKKGRQVRNRRQNSPEDIERKRRKNNREDS